MGGKSSSAPAPDPRLVEAQIRSMGVQENVIQRMMSNSDSMLPLQKETMQFGLDTSKAAYKDSQADRSWMLTRRGMLSTAQDKIAADSANFNENDRANEYERTAMANIDKGLSGANEAAIRSGSRYGLNTAKLGASMGRQDMGAAAAKAQAGFMARTAARAEGLQLSDRTANTLAGYPAMASGQTGAGAGYGAAGLGVANQGLAGMNSGYGSAGGVAGQMGQNATNMYGQQASYKSAQDKTAAENDPFKTVLGAATGAGMSMLMSDRRLKTNLVPVGKMDNGLTVYSYRYKAGGATHLGVIADEARQVRPEAVHRLPSGYDAVDYAKL